MTQQQNSNWKDESEKIEADMWAYNQGIDGEMIHWIWVYNYYEFVPS